MIKTKSQIGYYFEKFKAFLLVFLMILCVVQIGILWSSQSGSVPFSFLSSLFSTSKLISETTVEDAKGDYLLPYRVMLSAGFDDDHYIIQNGSQDYKKLWDGARLYVAEALDTDPKQIQIFNEDVWGGLVAKKPYTFEFNTQIPIDIIKWVFDLKASAGEGLPGIYKLVICPDDPDNSYTDTIYIRDNSNIYTYEIPDFKGEALGKQEFSDIFERQQTKENAKNYQLAIERYRKAAIKISLDMVGPLTQKSTETYPDVSLTSFTGATGKNYSIDDFNHIGRELFGKNSNEYDYDLDINGSAVFKKADGVYRLYKSSVLEFKYIGSQGIPEKRDIAEAYKKALSFIIDRSRQNDLMSNISVYLKSIEEKNNSYVFNFDYSVILGDENGEVPVLLKGYKISDGGKLLNNSISIEASSKRVTHCEWIVMKFKPNKNMLSYEWSFPDMHARAFNTYEELGKQELSAKDFGIYYVLNNSKQQAQTVTPSFVLFTVNGSYDVPVSK